MTKSLTEKWKDGELPEGEYFVITTWSDEIRPLSFYGDCFSDTEVPLDNSVIVEVLSAVPSYYEYKELETKCHQLKKELDIYKRAIERTDRIEKCLNQEGQIKNLQEQLKEANNVIKKYMSVVFEIRSEEENPTVLQLAFDYLKRWGVK